jgi:hypothetical protein
MSRYDFDPEDFRAPAPRAKQKSAPKAKNAEPEHGRGGSGGGEQPKSKNRPERARNVDRGSRRPRQDRDREYKLRESDVATLIEIAKFRTVKNCRPLDTRASSEVRRMRVRSTRPRYNVR